MKLDNLSFRKITLLNFSLIISLSVIIPILLDFIEIKYKITIISVLGNLLVLILISIMVIDSNIMLPLTYKIVAIWAGEQGSIMTWMLFNSLIINFYRIKNHNKEDLVFIRSVIISLIISTVFLTILFSLNPFKVESPLQIRKESQI